MSNPVPVGGPSGKWTLKWREEFNEELGPKFASGVPWAPWIGQPVSPPESSSEVACYDSECCTIADSILTLKAIAKTQTIDGIEYAYATGFHQDGQRSCLHGNRQTLDHIGAVAGGGSQRDAAHRTIVGAGVVFGDPDQEAGDDQADHRTDIERAAGDDAAVGRGEAGVEAAQDPHHDQGDGDQRQDAGGDQALVERGHDLLRGAQADEEGADHRGDDAGAADGQREQHQGVARRAGEEDRGQQHGGDDGHHIGLEQVGRHAGAVADIVADIVGDHGRVARIVLGNAGFDLADQIGADIGALGEDAAAETGEDRDQRGAEGERDQRLDQGDVPRSQDCEARCSSRRPRAGRDRPPAIR